METRNEKWESLRLEAQKFAPHEYVAKCTPQYNVKYTIDKGGMVAGVHCVADIGEDDFYTSADAAQTKTITSDGSGGAAEMYYVGKGWGKPLSSGQLPIPSCPPGEVWNEQYMKDHYGFSLFYLVSENPTVPPTHPTHVYAANKIEDLIVNAS